MASKWKYQKGKYKYINIPFRIENDDDMALYHYVKEFDNQVDFVKSLIEKDLWESVGYENE